MVTGGVGRVGGLAHVPPSSAELSYLLVLRLQLYVRRLKLGCRVAAVVVVEGVPVEEGLEGENTLARPTVQEVQVNLQY